MNGKSINITAASSRRKFIKQYFFVLPTLLAAGFITGCKENPTNDKKKAETKRSVEPCEDFSGITEKELEARKKLGYVKDSPIAESTCSKCNLFLPPPADKPCGSCMLFKGPVYASGYCTYWTAKQG